MNKGIVLGAFVASVAFLLSSIGQAAERPATPGVKVNWANPNDSYLQDVKLGTGESDLLNPKKEVLDSKSVLKMQQEYMDLTREYEMKQNYGIATPADEQEQNKRVSHFSQYVVGSITEFQVNSNMEKAGKSSSEGRAAQKVQQSVQTVIRGSTNLNFSNDLKFGTKTNLRAREGELWMKSFLFNAAFKVDLGNDWKGNENRIDPTHAQDDRYRLVANRDWKIWGLASGMNYGTQSTRMTNSLIKTITPHLSAEVAQTHGVNKERAQMPRAEESVVLRYGISF